MEQVSLAGGPNLPQVVMEKQTIKEAYQKFTVKDTKVEAVLQGRVFLRGRIKTLRKAQDTAKGKFPMRETYAKLRRASPSSKIQREVNKNIDDIIGTEDFALPGKIIDKKLHEDHIVSLEKIARMEGFGTLTYNQQKEIVNFVENFIGLSEAANTSKGSKSFADWYIYKKENIPVNPEFRENDIKRKRTRN
ncbi:hypothetical protein [Peribacillus sp. NPDC097895]|uniref:hypothetical protein n=1 Tax=Peribacillus sp. NPDC097895 TaxID=3390619 RepID=UPI003CFBD6FD